jgi:hypothetical protein
MLTLEDGREVDGSTGTHSLGVVALLEETVDTTDGELKIGALGGRGLAGLSLARPEAGEEKKGAQREVSQRTGRARRWEREGGKDAYMM